jgi:hypothetical protein
MHPEKYKAALNNKDFFNKYEEYKKQLKIENENWEKLVEQL